VRLRFRMGANLPLGAPERPLAELSPAITRKQSVYSVKWRRDSGSDEVVGFAERSQTKGNLSYFWRS
jgi:hypothetical protein